MKRLQTFQLNFKLNNQQQSDIWCFADVCRFAFKRGSVVNNENRKEEKKYAPHAKMALWFIDQKLDVDAQCFKEALSQSLQQLLKILHWGCKHFFQTLMYFSAAKSQGKTEVLTICNAKNWLSADI